MPDLIRQHLIDPVACARCNTCADICPAGAISYKKNRYIIDPTRCDGCGECLEDCPSGSIDHWYMVPEDAPYTLDQQLSWPELPAPDPAMADEGVAGPGILYPPNAPATVHVVSVTSLVSDGASQDIRQIVFDMGDAEFPFIEGQSLGILPPASPDEPAPALRLYSIASARAEGGQNHVSLCVKRVTQDHEGNAYLGLCSNYLCDLSAGDAVQVAGPYGQHFLMPEDAAAPLLWIATGTGISPARAMAERKLRSGSGDPDGFHLFYGARTQADMAFLPELRALDGDALRFRPAFSRDPAYPRTYAQDRLLEQADDIRALLSHPACHIFMCGMKGLDHGAFAALEQICAASGENWSELAAQMKSEGRLLIETY